MGAIAMDNEQFALMIYQYHPDFVLIQQGSLWGWRYYGSEWGIEFASPHEAFAHCMYWVLSNLAANSDITEYEDDDDY